MRVDAEKAIQIGDSLWLFIFSFDLLFSVRRTSCFDYVAGQEGCPETAAASAAAAAEAAAAAAASAIQREERSKVLRERQNEERQRKLEELKQQVKTTISFYYLNFLWLVHFRFLWFEFLKKTLPLSHGRLWPALTALSVSNSQSALSLRIVVCYCVSCLDKNRRWLPRNFANNKKRIAVAEWRKRAFATWNAVPWLRSAKKPSWLLNLNVVKPCWDAVKTVELDKKSNDATNADPSPLPLAAPRPGCWNLSTAAQVIGVPGGIYLFYIQPSSLEKTNSDNAIVMNAMTGPRRPPMSCLRPPTDVWRWMRWARPVVVLTTSEPLPSSDSIRIKVTWLHHSHSLVLFVVFHPSTSFLGFFFPLIVYFFSLISTYSVEAFMAKSRYYIDIIPLNWVGSIFQRQEEKKEVWIDEMFKWITRM